MPVFKEQYRKLLEELSAKQVRLVAVSKTKPQSDIMELYELGHRDFGENYVQELVDKAAQLPKNINWHFIGHLQSNKVKLIVPFVQLIHSVDSLKLLGEIDKQAAKLQRVIDILLQIHIAEEETKFGLDEKELAAIIPQLSNYSHIRFRGLMGMATFTEDEKTLRKEFRFLKAIYKKYVTAPDGILSMGMSSDYALAIEEGSNLVRIGSLVFGQRS